MVRQEHFIPQVLLLVSATADEKNSCPCVGSTLDANRIKSHQARPVRSELLCEQRRPAELEQLECDESEQRAGLAEVKITSSYASHLAGVWLL